MVWEQKALENYLCFHLELNAAIRKVAGCPRDTTAVGTVGLRFSEQLDIIGFNWLAYDFGG